MQQIFQSVSIALQNIKANPLHTFLSTLGIIIGVASLVAILALGDGLEQTGREQIESTTSIQMMTLTPKTIDLVDGVRVPRDTVYQLGLKEARMVEEELNQWGYTDLIAQSSKMATYKDSSIAIYIQATLDNIPHFTEAEIIGRYYDREDIENTADKTVLTIPLARKWSEDPEELIGESISFEGTSYEVIGILQDESQGAQALIPLSTYQKNLKNSNTPNMIFKSRKVEDIPSMKSSLENWLDENYEDGKEAFSIFTYEGRVKQLSQGILVFKLVMGAITGISVLVGGIGIMNVLLISVTERTKEIGIRKAAGARKKDIVLQFISESVTISMVGCIIGWAVGVIGVFGLVEIINRFTDFGFQAALSLGTVFVVLIVAVLVGMLFGTYPAWKAANLTPVDAIRHE
ncbi:ABC transporter permease [Gracilimonas halophila]|uniref:ABC transporter permease n=1 Tax=Gracilimonas halophila TaxID=1834464 RepID=A0ABW5JLF1_9BACT